MFQCMFDPILYFRSHTFSMLFTGKLVYGKNNIKFTLRKNREHWADRTIPLTLFTTITMEIINLFGTEISNMKSNGRPC